MIWFKALKVLFLLLAGVGLKCLFEPADLTLTFREVGVIQIVIGSVGYLLVRGALGFTRRALSDTVDPRGPKGDNR